MNSTLNSRLWRNPYSVQKRKKSKPQVRTGANLALIPPPKKEAKSMKISLLKIKDQVHSFREQMEQVESTMGTLVQMLDAMERFGGLSKVGGTVGKNQANLLSSLNQIDFKQVMNLLQSPLVQALLETLTEEKKPGKVGS